MGYIGVTWDVGYKRDIGHGTQQTRGINNKLGDICRGQEQLQC